MEAALDTTHARRTAALLLIGNELLTGKVQDQNFAYLARELYALGVELRRVVIVLDEVDTIAAELRGLSRAHDLVFTSGGVGPTHDDVTFHGVAQAFESQIERHAALEEILRAHYGERLSEGHLRMADVPRGVELVQTPELRWPVLLMKNVYILPGVPEFFQLKFAALRARFQARPFVLAEIFLRCDEPKIAEPLRAVAEQHPTVQLGSYPRFDDADHRVKLTLESKDPDDVNRALHALLAVLSPDDVLRISSPFS